MTEDKAIYTTGPAGLFAAAAREAPSVVFKTAIVFYCKVCGGLMLAVVNGEHIAHSADDISQCIKEGHRMAEISIQDVRTQKWCTCGDNHEEVR
jgi:hypothetical protein